MNTEITDHATERKYGEKPAKQKFGLVLQGGGALGAYEVGAVEYLYERGMECAIVTGASAGALNAAALAGATQYPPRVLRKLWEKIAVDSPIPFLPEIPVPLPQWLTRLWFSYIRRSWCRACTGRGWMSGICLIGPTSRSPRWARRWTLSWTGSRYATAEHMRLTVSASGVEDGTVAYFTNIPAGKLPPEPEYQPVQFGVEHVLASGSFPGGFPWTTIQNRAYWDGGLTDNTPLKPILDNLTEDEAASMPIYMIDVNVAAAPRPGNLYGVSQRMLELLVSNRLRSDLDTATSYTKFISVLKQVDEQLPSDAPLRKEQEWEDVMSYHRVRQISMIDMKKPAEDSAGDFSRESILRRISAGYDQTRAALEAMPPAWPATAQPEAGRIRG